MKMDETALDTILGTLLLILVCFFCSSILICVSFNQNETDMYEDFEKRLNVCLSSTITVQYEVKGEKIQEKNLMSEFLMDYSLSIYGDRELLLDYDLNEIQSIIDFCFSSASHWELSIVTTDDDQLFHIESENQSQSQSEIYVLERAFLEEADKGILLLFILAS